MNAQQKAAAADSIDVWEIINKANRQAEKSSSLTPITLRRDSFYDTATSTGSLCLDQILGGGIPPSRMVGIAGPEHSGKSLLSTQIAHNQCSAGRVSSYQDAEGGSDPLFLKARGLNFDKFLGARDKKGNLKKGQKDFWFLYQPTTGEAVTNYIHTLTGAMPEDRTPSFPPVIFFLDSVVALITDKVGEDIDSNKMAMHARMYSELLPIIRSDLNRTGCSFVYVNQKRLKPGVSYGCIQGDCILNFVDGRSLPLREVVEKKIEGEVWSHTDGVIKPAKITNWFNNGPSNSDDWVRIKTEGPGSGNGFYSVVATKNHKILKADGSWVEAGKLEVGEELVSKYEEVVQPNTIAEEFLCGVLSGDSCVPKDQRNKDILVLSNNEQPDYMDWKLSKLSRVLQFKKHKAKGIDSHQFISKPNISLGKLASLFPNRNPIQCLDKMGWLSIAVWYMDDGSADFRDGHCRACISVKRLKNDPTSLKKIANWFGSKGIRTQVSKDRTKLIFNADAFRLLSSKIKRFIPGCMEYKLPHEFRGQYQDFNLEPGKEFKKLPVKILEIKNGIGNREKTKYDIEVEGSHNYLVGSKRGGLIVHNSPEYEPAGQALKFHADIRLELKRVKPKMGASDHPFTKESPWIKGGNWKAGGVWQEPHLGEDGTMLGLDRYIYTGITTIKNKVFTPWQTCWMRIQFDENGGTGRGLDPVFDIFTFLAQNKYIRPAQPRGEGKNKEKVTDIRPFWEIVPETSYDLHKELLLPDRFDYPTFKKWAGEPGSGLVQILREEILSKILKGGENDESD